MSDPNLVVVRALTQFEKPTLYAWRDKTDKVDSMLRSENGSVGKPTGGFWEFRVPADYHIHEFLYCKLHDGDVWEPDEHNRRIDRANNTTYEYPEAIWLVEGTSRVLVEDPLTAPARSKIRIHLVTHGHLDDAKLHLWTPASPGVDHSKTSVDGWGPYYDVELQGLQQRLFAFVFHDEKGWELKSANRLWTSRDGTEIWVVPNSSLVVAVPPTQRQLKVHFKGMKGATELPKLHLWHTDSGYKEDFPGQEKGAWIEYLCPTYDGRKYGFKFHNDGLALPWEHAEADRETLISGDAELWTLEGDHTVFESEPSAEVEVALTIADRPPSCPLHGDDLELDVWVNQGKLSLVTGLAPKNGVYKFRAYRNVVLSFRFRQGETTERIDRHYLRLRDATVAQVSRFVVLDRPDPVERRPPVPLFQDPPFTLRRPGAFVDGDQMRFVLHAPKAASAEVIGDFTGWRTSPLAMRSTRDEAYFWAQVPLAELLQGLGKLDYHGSYYKFLLNGNFEVQDPAADWVENSSADAASRLVDHGKYVWRSQWDRPGWEYPIMYEIHVSRFSKRTWGLADPVCPLKRVRLEVERDEGHLRQVGCTAVLLMPIAEFAGDVNWGYCPAFFYAVESSYGGPDEFKALVDACHARGLAVYLDVVPNHAGSTDNVLWSIARDTYFRGDSTFGSMLNFDNDRMIHFFEQNLVHFMANYRIDGFRFDATWLVRHAGEKNDLVREPGSKNGWGFMQKLRRASRDVDNRVLLVAEHLPVERDISDDGGPMDSQWNDRFRGSVSYACDGGKNRDMAPEVARALQSSYLDFQHWFEATNFPVSHDNAGKDDRRISHVAGDKRGYRMAKVAGAATLLSRGMPMWFMGEEFAEWRRFDEQGDAGLDLDSAVRDQHAKSVRDFWQWLCRFRTGNPKVSGGAPLWVHFAEGNLVAFSRGSIDEFFVVLNFGEWNRYESLRRLNLPDNCYKELMNSRWYPIAVEGEDPTGSYDNGGWAGRLTRDCHLKIPGCGAVLLERV